MNTLKNLLFLTVFVLSGNSTFSQDIADSTAYKDNDQKITNNLYSQTVHNTTVLTVQNNDTISVAQNTMAYPPSFRDYKRLGYNTGMFIGATVVAFGILYSMPESATNWDKAAMKENGIAYKWKQNVKEGPVIDKDDWVLNWVTHPYSGGVYYMTARSSGFTWYQSFLYSAFMSTFFWEYGIEAFAEVPSIQDLIITPVVGSMIGEGFFYAKKSIMRHDKKVLKSKVLGTTALFLIDPFNTILDGFGYKAKQNSQLNLAPVGFDKTSNKPIWGLNFNVQF